MDTSRSLRTRAVMALFLMVGFYGFSLAIAGGLLWIPYAEYTYLDRVDGRLALFCVIGAGTILWALVPRIDKFEAPGPRLTPATAPYLFTIIEEVAKATSQPRPEEVYLLGEVNAFVTHRGGFMGFGSQPRDGRRPAVAEGAVARGAALGHRARVRPLRRRRRGARSVGLQDARRDLPRARGSERQHPAVAVQLVRPHVHAHDDQVSREQEFAADATAARWRAGVRRAG